MKKVTFSVTDLDQVIWFLRLEDMTLDELVAKLRHEAGPSEKAAMGTAFHAALENSQGGVIDEIESGGIVFRVECDAEVVLPQLREIKAQKTYAVHGVEVTLRGKCDGISGNAVLDHKLTFNPRPEYYFDSYQWRAYLDIFNADLFTYYLYHGKADPERVIIREVSPMSMFRYPGMEEDLRAGIGDLLDLAQIYLPEKFEAIT